MPPAPRRRPLRLLAVTIAALGATGLTLVKAADYPSWPLQKQPGPDGDPRQDKASYPKSRAPVQAPVKKTLPPRPAFLDAGHGDWTLGGGWRLQETRKVAATAKELSEPGYDTARWFDATVPGTVLTTLVDQGVYPEPTYGLDNMAIPESLNREDYWYRNEFTPPPGAEGRGLTLTFNGINYAADVWLNGARLGAIRGAFRRGIFDVTGKVRPGRPNALLVRISPVPHPGIPHEESLEAGAGPNGGAMLFDGPTFFCTEGWDWIPGIRDRVAGIWQDVVLHVGGPLAFGDVQVKTELPLPSLAPADITITAELANRSGEEQNATVRGEFEGVSFEKPVTLAAGATTELRFAPAEFAGLRVRSPRLWWPNGYGKPELYRLTLTVRDPAGQVRETKSLRFGIRHVTYELSALDAKGGLVRFELDPSAAGATAVIDKRHAALRRHPTGWVPTFVAGQESSPAVKPLAETDTAPNLVFRVNGRRVVAKGGNWGLDEAMKRISRERMEPFFRMERDAHMTMIRNWCGQNTEEVFFDLADEYGLMVWSDFWTSTQEWNLQPGDLDLWLDNARDTIRRFRNHPSIVVWCGRNEGVPPPYLNEGVDALVREHDGTRYYQPNSRNVNLLESGPWVWNDPANFFTRHGKGFTTELGLPSPPTADAIRAMMPEADWWPIGDSWAYHDWHQKHHGEVQPFVEALATWFGEPTSLDDFARKAQMLNYVGHRAMFEGLNANLWKPASGRLMWMSHPAWPSMEWQLYSSDYDAHAAYWGARKAAEPVHVQLNRHDGKVVVTNNTFEPIAGAVVQADVHGLDGRRLAGQKAVVTAAANATTEAFALDATRSASLPVSFVKLRLTVRGQLVSDNFYWQARTDADHRALNGLPRVALAARVRRTPGGVELELRNPSRAPALLVRPTLRDAQGRRVLPVYASDGYFSLLPGETRRVRLEAPGAASAAQLTLDGWNTAPGPVTLP